MSDDSDEIPASYEDPIASRVVAYAALLATVADLEETALRAEGMAMLAAVRETVRTGPRGELKRIK